MEVILQCLTFIIILNVEFQNDLNIKMFDVGYSNVECQNDMNVECQTV